MERNRGRGGVRSNVKFLMSSIQIKMLNTVFITEAKSWEQNRQCVHLDVKNSQGQCRRTPQEFLTLNLKAKQLFHCRGMYTRQETHVKRYITHAWAGKEENCKVKQSKARPNTAT